MIWVVVVPYYNRDPKRDHNFDNHPYEEGQGVQFRSTDFSGFYIWVSAGWHQATYGKHRQAKAHMKFLSGML